MKILITGATGYIGSTVATRLQAKGHAVIGLARSDQSAAQLEAKGITVHRGDLLEPQTLTAGAQLVDAVIHTAMPDPTSGIDLAEIAQIALDSTQALIKGLADKNGILIVTSGTGAYGDTGEDLVDEQTPIAAFGPLEKLGIAEQQALHGAEQGIRGLVIRPSLVYGSGGSGPILALINGIKQLGYAGYVPVGDSQLSTVHVEDLADLYLLAIEQVPVGGLFNAVGEIVSTKAIVAAAQSAAGVDGELREFSAEEAMQMGFIGSYLNRNMRVSAEKAKRDLGWQPRRISILDDLQAGSYQEK